MADQKLTQRIVDGADPRERRYTLYDAAIPGFGLRVFPSGQKSWVFDYRPGEGGRSTPKKRVTIGAVEDFTATKARQRAERLRAAVLSGGDPQGDKSGKRAAATVEALATEFLAEHVEMKRAPSTKAYYEDLLNRLVLPELGRTKKAKDVLPSDMNRLHKKLKDRPYLANRVLAVVGSMYGYAEGPAGLVPKGTNPTVDIEKFEEPKRDRLLSAEELGRLGAALHEAETTGIPWELREGAKDKHRARPENRLTVLSPYAVAAIRLLLFTGCRLREVLHLTWEQVDMERGLLLLPKHKTSRKTGVKSVVLNSPALEVLKGITRIGVFVIAGDTAGKKDEKPRSDLKRPWALVTKRAGLDGLRLHDLRHNFASFGVGGGMGLPIIGKLLGHVQAATTSRYAHLDNDPLRRASNTIGSAIAAAISGDRDDKNVIPLPGARGGS